MGINAHTDPIFALFSCLPKPDKRLGLDSFAFMVLVSDGPPNILLTLRLHHASKVQHPLGPPATYTTHHIGSDFHDTRYERAKLHPTPSNAPSIPKVKNNVSP